MHSLGGKARMFEACQFREKMTKQEIEQRFMKLYLFSRKQLDRKFSPSPEITTAQVS